MSKDEIFEAAKSAFENWGKKDVIEYLSTILSELVSNGVNISACETTPPYIEWMGNDGMMQRAYGRRDKISIREQLTLNFARHDEEVRKELMKNIAKSKGRKTCINS